MNICMFRCCWPMWLECVEQRVANIHLVLVPEWERMFSLWRVSRRTSWWEWPRAKLWSHRMSYCRWNWHGQCDKYGERNTRKRIICRHTSSWSTKSERNWCPGSDIHKTCKKSCSIGRFVDIIGWKSLSSAIKKISARGRAALPRCKHMTAVGEVLKHISQAEDTSVKLEGYRLILKELHLLTPVISNSIHVTY